MVSEPTEYDEQDPFDEAFQRRLESLSLISKRVFAGRTRADRRSKKAGSGVEFADYRQYSAGDDDRYIDWGAYARLGRLLLRLYEEEEDLSVYLLVDRSASMGVGRPSKLFHAKRIAAALAYIALNHLDRVALVGLGEARPQPRLAPTRGRNRIFQVLEFLRRLDPSGPTNLAASIGDFVARHRRRGVVLVLSDFFDPDHFEEGLDKLRYARFEAQIIQLVDPQDEAPNLRGELRLRDAETGDTRTVTVTGGMLARYRSTYQAHQTRVARFCGDKQLPLVQLSTTISAEQAVLHLLRRGGMVG